MTLNIIIFYENTSKIVGRSIIQSLSLLRNTANIENLDRFSAKDFDNEEKRKRIKHLLNISWKKCLIIMIGYSTNATVNLLLKIWTGFQDIYVSFRCVCITYSLREKERLENTSLCGQSGFMIFKNIQDHTALNVNSRTLLRDIIREIQELNNKPPELDNENFCEKLESSQVQIFLDSRNVSTEDIQNLSCLDWDIIVGHDKAGQVKGLIREIINKVNINNWCAGNVNDDVSVKQLKNLIRTSPMCLNI